MQKQHNIVLDLYALQPIATDIKYELSDTKVYPLFITLKDRSGNFNIPQGATVQINFVSSVGEPVPDLCTVLDHDNGRLSYMVEPSNIARVGTVTANIQIFTGTERLSYFQGFSFEVWQAQAGNGVIPPTQSPWTNEFNMRLADHEDRITDLEENGTPGGGVVTLPDNLAYLERIEGDDIIITPPLPPDGDTGGAPPPPTPQSAMVFIPDVSETGVISWTLDTPIMPPQPRNIMGANGWIAKTANVIDENMRIVQQVYDWFGGTGEKPPTGMYLGENAFTDDPLQATDIRGFQGAIGARGERGADGQDGADGQQGAQGAQGIQGEQGSQGPAGLDGLDFTRANDPFLLTNVYMQRDVVVSDMGFTFYARVDNLTGVPLPTDNITTTEWAVVGGPEGPQGIQGVQGLQGERGLEGRQAPEIIPEYVYGLVSTENMSMRNGVWVQLHLQPLEGNGIQVVDETQFTSKIILPKNAQYMTQMSNLWGGGNTLVAITKNTALDPDSITDPNHTISRDGTGSGTDVFAPIVDLSILQAGDELRIWVNSSVQQSSLNRNGRLRPEFICRCMSVYGERGEKGEQGDKGEPGEQGVPGTPGAPGASFTPATGHFYRQGGGTLFSSQPVDFTADTAVQNISYTRRVENNEITSIQIQLDGTYQFTFGMSITSAAANTTMALAINGAYLEGSGIIATVGNNAGAGVFELKAGDTIRLVNYGSNTVLFGEGLVNSAYLSISKVG